MKLVAGAAGPKVLAIVAVGAPWCPVGQVIGLYRRSRMDLIPKTTTRGYYYCGKEVAAKHILTLTKSISPRKAATSVVPKQ